jgi:hypothetical protein
VRASLTRSHLHELEGRHVIYRSYYQDRKPALNGTFKMLLRNVQLGLYTPTRCVLDTTLTHRCDHCWIVLPEFDSNGSVVKTMGIQRYAKGFGYGKVSYYTRTDQSIDLSIKPLPFISMDLIPQLNKDLSNLTKVIKLYRAVLELAKSNKYVLLSQRYNHDQAIRILTDHLKYYEGVAMSQSSKYFQAGLKKKVTSASSFKDLLLAK